MRSGKSRCALRRPSMSRAPTFRFGKARSTETRPNLRLQIRIHKSDVGHAAARSSAFGLFLPALFKRLRLCLTIERCAAVV
jgi:hypothetical protein